MNATDAERLLWSRLRRRQIAGFKFRRQHQVGLYICDFACLDRMLVVELDGSQHAENLEYDQRRDRLLRSAGFEVLRFWNNDVLGSIEGVLDTIYAALDRSSDPSRPCGGTSPFEWGGAVELHPTLYIEGRSGPPIGGAESLAS